MIGLKDWHACTATFVPEYLNRTIIGLKDRSRVVKKWCLTGLNRTIIGLKEASGSCRYIVATFCCQFKLSDHDQNIVTSSLAIFQTRSHLDQNIIGL